MFSSIDDGDAARTNDSAKEESIPAQSTAWLAVVGVQIIERLTRMGRGEAS